MRLAILFGLLLAAPAWGEAPLTDDPHFNTGPAARKAEDALLDRTPVLAEVPTFTEDRFRLSADLGLPTGVRLGVRMGESRFWAEFGVGVWWIAPYTSVALRYDGRVYEGQRNTFALRPSLSVTIVPFDKIPVGFGGDMEIIWQHRFANRICTDLGLRLGMSAFANSEGEWWPVPVMSVVFALQF